MGPEFYGLTALLAQARDEADDVLDRMVLASLAILIAYEENQ